MFTPPFVKASAIRYENTFSADQPGIYSIKFQATFNYMMTTNSSDFAPLPSQLINIEGEPPNRKHLAIFLPSLAGGGVARAMVYLSEAFADRNHRVDLILCQVSGPYLDSISPKVKVIGLKGGQNGGDASMPCQLILGLYGQCSFRSFYRLILQKLSGISRIWLNIYDVINQIRCSRRKLLRLIALLAARLAGGKTRIVINEQTSLSPIIKTSKKWRWRFLLLSCNACTLERMKS